MIDRPARDQLAERLRRLAIGRMTNRAFEASSERTTDPVILEIELRLAWPYYCDIREHRLTGEWRLSDGLRRDFARAVLFLKTDLEYEWTHQQGVRGWLNSWFHLRPLRRAPRIRPEPGDRRYWPFYRRSDYLGARRSPVYLHKAA